MIEEYTDPFESNIIDFDQYEMEQQYKTPGVKSGSKSYKLLPGVKSSLSTLPRSKMRRNIVQPLGKLTPTVPPIVDEYYLNQRITQLNE
jgi:hypothetical protein